MVITMIPSMALANTGQNGSQSVAGTQPEEMYALKINQQSQIKAGDTIECKNCITRRSHIESA